MLILFYNLSNLNLRYSAVEYTDPSLYIFKLLWIALCWIMPFNFVTFCLVYSYSRLQQFRKFTFFLSVSIQMIHSNWSVCLRDNVCMYCMYVLMNMDICMVCTVCIDLQFGDLNSHMGGPSDAISKPLWLKTIAYPLSGVTPTARLQAAISWVFIQHYLHFIFA